MISEKSFTTLLRSKTVPGVFDRLSRRRWQIQGWLLTFVTTVRFPTSFRTAIAMNFVKPIVSVNCGLVLVTVLSLPGCGQTSSEPGATVPGGRSSNTEGTPPESHTTSLSFSDVTHSSGLTWVYRNGEEAEHFAILESLGGGVGILDFDADGLADAILPGGGKYDGPNLQQINGLPTGVFHNIGTMTFRDVSVLSAASTSDIYTHGVACCDVDSDGFTDFLLTGYGGLQLFMNQGDGTFAETAKVAGLLDELWSSSAAFGDFNLDGNPDLYVAHYVNWSFENHPACPGPELNLRDVCPPKDFEPLRDSFYLSNGDGSFREASDEWGLRPDGKGLGVVVGDIDVDGDLDVYVGNDTVPNFLYRNRGDQFEDAGLMSGASVSDRGTADGSMGVDLGDFNLDGLPDLWVANYESEGFAMYRNEGDCFFQPVSTTLGINAISGLYVGWGTAFFDADLDSDLDLFVSNGHVIRYPSAAPLRQLPIVLESRDGQRFTNVAAQAGDYTSTPHMGRGLAVADLDRDGDQDLIVSHSNESVAVLENCSSREHHWIGFALNGTVSARDAHGTIIRVTLTNSEQRVLQVKSGSSYASTNERTQILGLGETGKVASVSFHWPSGMVTSLSTPTVGVVHQVLESSIDDSIQEVLP